MRTLCVVLGIETRHDCSIKKTTRGGCHRLKDCSADWYVQKKRPFCSLLLLGYVCFFFTKFHFKPSFRFEKRVSQTLTEASFKLLYPPTISQGNEDYTGMAARDTANALRTLVGAARGVAANLPDLQAQLHLLDKCRDVMDKSINLMQEAKLAVEDPDNPENRQRLAQVILSRMSSRDVASVPVDAFVTWHFPIGCFQVAKAVSHALNNCINCLPGQRDVDEALKNIADSSKRLLSGQVRKIAWLAAVAQMVHFLLYKKGWHDFRMRKRSCCVKYCVWWWVCCEIPINCAYSTHSLAVAFSCLFALHGWTSGSCLLSNACFTKSKKRLHCVVVLLRSIFGAVVATHCYRFMTQAIKQLLRVARETKFLSHCWR